MRQSEPPAASDTLTGIAVVALSARSAIRRMVTQEELDLASVSRPDHRRASSDESLATRELQPRPAERGAYEHGQPVADCGRLEISRRAHEVMGQSPTWRTRGCGLNGSAGVHALRPRSDHRRSRSSPHAGHQRQLAKQCGEDAMGAGAGALRIASGADGEPTGLFSWRTSIRHGDWSPPTPSCRPGTRRSRHSVSTVTWSRRAVVRQFEPRAAHRTPIGFRWQDDHATFRTSNGT